MKKLYIFFLLLVCSNNYAQDAGNNLKKYWYYRERLKNDFMVVGDCQGCSLPASERALYPGNTMKWGDATIMLGYYFGVLATEFKLLNDNGGSCDETKKELFYALQAFNRLDYNAEPEFENLSTGIPGANSLNGFFIRDDVPREFIVNHIAELNTKKYSQYVVSGILPDDNTDFNAPSKTQKEMSHDQVWHLMMGLSLINRFVDDGATYNGQAFMDGETRIVYEARNIIDRMINYMKVNNSVNWIIKNPITLDPVNRGSNAAFLSYGAAEAACKATSRTNYTHVATGTTCSGFHDAVSISTMLLWSGVQVPAVLTGTAIFNGQDFKVMLLAALGNSWYLGGPPFLINTTSAQLYTWNQIHDYKYLSLLRQLLHGGNNPVSDSYYINLLNSAPCEGPYKFYDHSSGQINYNNTSYSNYEWSSDNRLFLPENRGNEGPFDGEYNGLDYMLLFNMYSLAKGNTYLESYSDFINVSNNTTFPFYFAVLGNYWGTTTIPLQVAAFKTLTSRSVITSVGNEKGYISFRAGEEIILKDGFQVTNGATFHAYIDPFECVGGSYRNSGDSTEADTSLYGFPDFIFEETMPHYEYAEEEEATEEFNAKNTSDSTQKSRSSAQNNLSEVELLNTAENNIDHIKITCSPNPVKEQALFNIELTKEQAVNFCIFNSMGQLVYKNYEVFSSGLNIKSIETSRFPAGVYFYSVKTTSYSTTGRMVVMRE